MDLKDSEKALLVKEKNIWLIEDAPSKSLSNLKIQAAKEIHYKKFPSTLTQECPENTSETDQDQDMAWKKKTSAKVVKSHAKVVKGKIPKKTLNVSSVVTRSSPDRDPVKVTSVARRSPIQDEVRVSSITTRSSPDRNVVKVTSNTKKCSPLKDQVQSTSSGPSSNPPILNKPLQDTSKSSSSSSINEASLPTVPRKSNSPIFDGCANFISLAANAISTSASNLISSITSTVPQSETITNDSRPKKSSSIRKADVAVIRQDVSKGTVDQAKNTDEIVRQQTQQHMQLQGYKENNNP